MEKKIDYTWLKSLGDIRELCDNVVEKYRRVEEENNRLKKENADLKSGAWKEDMAKKLKEQYEEMRADYFRGFSISEEEEKAINEFKKAHNDCNFHYVFIPCAGIGVIGKIVASNKDNIEFIFQEP